MSDSMLVSYAREELKRAGMYDADADYGAGEIAGEVLKVIEALDSGGHSGGSMMTTLGIVEKLARFQPLTPLTNKPDEWMDVTEISGNNPMWQSRRAPTCFSTDGGKTYYDLDEKGRPVHETADAR